MRRFFLFCVVFLGWSACGENSENTLWGSWAFHLPDGRPVWLDVQPDTTASLLWSVGSPRPVQDVRIDGNQLEFFREFGWRPFGNPAVYSISEPITGVLTADDKLLLTVIQSHDNGVDTLRLAGKRMPPIPPAPDLSAVQFGEPVDLIANGMEGWRLANPDKENGWRLDNGVLINETPKKDFGAYGHYGNLQTKQTFMDFELNIDYNVPVGGNSGIYLRGAYEVQVVDRDSPMQGIQGPGAVFGRIKPRSNAANPGGEWNHYRILLIDRHITVELNGERVIDNQPLAGCTGGGINADDTAPGPIFLQGDHTSVRYRNIVLRPVLESDD